MADGDESLRKLAARLRAFGKGTEMAREARPLVEAALKATEAAGTDPYGNPWKPKKDGSRALINAANETTVTTNGKVILITIRGGLVPQNRFAFRKVLPNRKLPKAILDALREGARRAWAKAMSS